MIYSNDPLRARTSRLMRRSDFMALLLKRRNRATSIVVVVTSVTTSDVHSAVSGFCDKREERVRESGGSVRGRVNTPTAIPARILAVGFVMLSRSISTKGNRSLAKAPHVRVYGDIYKRIVQESGG